MSKYTYTATITRVIDGDTVVADIDAGFNIVLKDERLRLYGINTPEIRGDERAEGLKSKAQLKLWIEGKQVTIETFKDKRGKYGRYIATIYDENGNVNQRLVDDKLAVEVDY